MFSIAPSLTDTLTLQDVIKCWQQHELVTGIVVAGSGGRGELKPSSDYDIVLVLKDFPLPLHVMLTTIDGRMTDIAFIKEALLDDMLAMTHIGGNTQAGVVLDWVQGGVIDYDSTGKLTQLKHLKPERFTGDTNEYYSIWFRVNFNLYHTKRLLQSDDPVYLMAADLRMLYMLSEVYLWFMTVRGVAWRGEKHSVRYFQREYPAAFAIHQAALHESDRHKKFALYEQFVALALEPVGGVWASPKITAFTLADDLTPAAIEQLDQFWRDLINDND